RLLEHDSLPASLLLLRKKGTLKLHTGRGPVSDALRAPPTMPRSHRLSQEENHIDLKQWPAYPARAGAVLSSPQGGGSCLCMSRGSHTPQKDCKPSMRRQHGSRTTDASLPERKQSGGGVQATPA